MKQLGIMFACAALLGGCAQHVPLPASMTGPAGGCRLPVVKLSANQFDDPDEGASAVTTHFVTGGGSDTRRVIGTLMDAVRSPNKVEGPGNAKTVLVLSGGSLHGAFGAGLFYGWMNSSNAVDEKIPTYDVVTGVSTGALQSIFIFLDSSSDAEVRRSAFNDAERLKSVKFLAKRFGQGRNGVDKLGSSYLANLAHYYMPDREADLLQLHPLQRLSPNKIGMLELIGRPSVATMAPLRNVIRQQLGPYTIKGIATEARGGRKLYVAIADLTNSYGYAADLTKLAELADLSARPDQQTEQDKKDLVRVFPDYDPRDGRNLINAARECFVDALVASSTVPPGVPAVSIEIIKEDKDGHILNPDYVPNAVVPSNWVAGRHSFVDGGAAFAVFFSQLQHEVGELDNVDMDLIVNGSYYPKQWDKWLDKNGRTRKIENVKLNSLDYALQSAEILQTQVRLFSVQEARRWTQGRGRFRWAFIDNRQISPGSDGIDDLASWTGRLKGTPQQWRYSGNGNEKSCKEWHEWDEDHYHPMEFYPTYMQCVLNYGVERGRDPAHRWNMCVSKDASKCANES